MEIQKYDQLQVIKKVRQPLLLLRGQRDFQVSAIDATLWKNAIGPGDELTVKLYPKLKHFYTEREGAPSGMDYYHPANVPGYVIDDYSRMDKKALVMMHLKLMEGSGISGLLIINKKLYEKILYVFVVFSAIISSS